MGGGGARDRGQPAASCSMGQPHERHGSDAIATNSVSSWTSEAQIQDPLPQGVVWRRLVVISFRLTGPWGNGSWLSPGGRRMLGSSTASHHAFRHHHVVHVHV